MQPRERSRSHIFFAWIQFVNFMSTITRWSWRILGWWSLITCSLGGVKATRSSESTHWIQWTWNYMFRTWWTLLNPFLLPKNLTFCPWSAFYSEQNPENHKSPSFVGEFSPPFFHPPTQPPFLPCPPLRARTRPSSWPRRSPAARTRWCRAFAAPRGCWVPWSSSRSARQG